MSVFCCCSGCAAHGEGRCGLFVKSLAEGMTTGALIRREGLLCEACLEARKGEQA